jgi:enoyl-CoA hydratase/carnithine racemase
VTARPIEFEISPPIATLRWNRPDRANAINRAMVEQFAEHVRELERRGDVRVLFLRGSGGKFSAGADLRELAQHAQGPAAELVLADLLERMAALPMVVVGVLEGYALGGGFLISLYCDLRVATPDTLLGFTKLGRQWMPPWGLSRLARWLGVARAQQFLVARAMVTAREALPLGLVDRLATPTELESLLERLSRELCESPPEVIGELKRFFSQLQGAPHAHWDRISAAGFARTFAAAPAQAAIADFLSARAGKNQMG